MTDNSNLLHDFMVTFYKRRNFQKMEVDITMHCSMAFIDKDLSVAIVTLKLRLASL